MQPIAGQPPISKARLWTGRIVSGLVAAFMVMDGVMKVMMLPVVVEGSKKAGFPEGSMFWIGWVLLVCTLLYAIPRTSILGAILLTGYLGGAVVVHVRISDPLFSHTLFPVYFGVLAWGGLYLREHRLPSLIPLKS